MTEKTAPVDADLAVIEDSASSNAKKKIQLGNIPKSLVKTTLTSLAVDASTNSGTWVDLLSSSVTTTIGTQLLLFAHVSCDNSNNKGSAIQYFRLNVDGTGQKGVAATVQVNAEPVTVALVGQASVTAGSHTVKLQWYTSKGTVRCRPVTLPDENSAVMITEEVRV
jgi:hypothetical protein